MIDSWTVRLTNLGLVGWLTTMLGLPLVVACAGAGAPAVAPELVAAKESPEKPLMADDQVVETLFGVQVRDPYRWLEDASDPRVQNWVEAQDQNARNTLDALPERAAIAARLSEVLYVEQRSVPGFRRLDGQSERFRYFFTIKSARQEKAVHYFRDGLEGEPQVLLDPHRMSDDGSLSVGGLYPTHDGRRVAYLEKPNNADTSNLVVMDVDTRQVSVTDTIYGVRYTAPSWTPDGSAFYYTWTPNDPSVPPEERLAHAQVRLHRLGTPPESDSVVRGATGDASKLIGAGVSWDGKYVFAYERTGWVKNDVFVQFVERGDGVWHSLTQGLDALYSVEAHQGVFYVLTNEGAPRYRVFRVHPDQLERANWEEIVPEDPASVIEQLDVVGGHLVLSRLRRAHSQLEVRRLDGSLVREVELPDIGVASTLIGQPDADEAYYSFTSFTQPARVYRTSVARGGAELTHEAEVPVDASAFQVDQVDYASKDGTAVSMFIVYKKGLALDGNNPTRLYGYGGFNASMMPQFSASLFPWLERGGVFAMPNLRGGGEYGEDWHQAGMLENKQNVFDDFIAAAEYLIERGYTRKQRLAISGGSNGGLLVGAAMTQRPQLFEAVTCSVPVLDMVRYHKVGLGTAWIPEYGDPDNSQHFGFLYAYSPYHRVVEGTRYPALLVLSADADDRVDPMHARKFTAAVQAATSRMPPDVFLRIERNAGHGGADLRRVTIERLADEYAFLWDQLTD